MAIVKPFKGIRPHPKFVSQVASLPYDVMDRDEAKVMAYNNPYSFLHISRSEIDLEDDVSPYDPKVYEKAKTNLMKALDEGVFIEETNPIFYIYRQVMNGRIQTGLAACTSIDEYLSNIIKKHEYTRLEKEIDRINHFDICGANTEPVFLTYRSNNRIRSLIEEWTSENDPIYNFISDDNITHIVWIMDNKKSIEELQELFCDVDSFYIADGHHRSASAVKVGLKRREANMESYSGDEEFNFFLSVLFPHEDLLIMDYNRVVKDLNALSEDEFMIKLSKFFTIEVYTENTEFRPYGKHIFGMYINKQWYKLTPLDGTFDDNDPIGSLDASILQNNVLSPILNIHDPRTDKRIDFVGGIRGLKELERRADSDMKVAFALYPPSMEELLKISDLGYIMPPKSTWFEPKLRSGLFLHKL